MEGVDGLVRLLIYLVIGGLIIYVVYFIIGMLTIPQPIKNVILLVVAVVVLLWLLATFGIFTL